MKRVLLTYRLICLMFVFTLIGNCVFAQQDPIFSQYQNNPLSYNPAFAAYEKNHSVGMIFREQWAGLNGQATTGALNYVLPIDSTNMGFGLDIVYDHMPHIKRSGFFVNYGYSVHLNTKMQLSLGLKGGINYYDSRLSTLDRYDIDDNYIIYYGDFKRWLPNFGVGAYISSNNYVFGVAIPRLLENKFDPDDTTIDYNSREHRHYFVTGTYNHPLNKILTLDVGVSSIVVSGAPTTSDIKLGVTYNEKVSAGAMYRISDAVGAYVQCELSQFDFGISYDYTTTDLSKYNNGTYELFFKFKIPKRTKKILHEEEEIYLDTEVTEP